MTKKNKMAMAIVAIIAVVIVIWGAQLNAAGDNDKRIWGVEYHGISMSLYSEKTSFMLSELKALSFYIRNNTSKGMQMPPPNFNNGYAILMYDKYGKQLRYVGKKNEINRTIDVIPPKKDIHRIIYLDDYFDIKAPGDYNVIIIKYDIKNTIVTSNCISVSIQ